MSGWAAVWGALWGAVVGSVIAGFAAMTEPTPDQVYHAVVPGKPPPGTRSRVVDPVLWIDLTVSGIVIGALIGAVATARRPTEFVPPSDEVPVADTGTDVERFQASLRRRLAANLDLTRIPDDEFPGLLDLLRRDLQLLADRLAGQLPIQLAAAEEAAAVDRLVDEMLEAYERNRRERVAMGRPRMGGPQV